ncbi:hypothetical protein C8R46DRAFT_1081951 [Mycena filopes]|nr:hypothetical protein C8R46DRAFT_1081951 [Mycena filopes]
MLRSTCILLLTFFTLCARSQGTDIISVIVVPPTLGLVGLTLLSYAFEGKPGHELNNITMELMSGKAEDNGNDVVDIIAVGYSQSNSATIPFFPHASTPAGDYHVRMNGTIYDSNNSVVSNTTARSPTMNVPAAATFQCLSPAFEPLRSVSDPGYSPVRIILPAAGSVFLLSGFLGGDTVGELSEVDRRFSTADVDSATVELVNTATGFSTSPQPVTGGDLAEGKIFYTGNTSVTPGGWKLRMNYTAKSTGPLVSLSDEFYFALQAPCDGLASSASASSAPPSGTGTPAPTVSNGIPVPPPPTVSNPQSGAPAPSVSSGSTNNGHRVVPSLYKMLGLLAAVPWLL